VVGAEAWYQVFHPAAKRVFALAQEVVVAHQAYSCRMVDLDVGDCYDELCSPHYSYRRIQSSHRHHRRPIRQSDPSQRFHLLAQVEVLPSVHEISADPVHETPQSWADCQAVPVVDHCENTDVLKRR
jgi:hypothetical protein